MNRLEKIKISLLLVCILFATSLSAQVPKEIENSEIYGINKLPARTSVWPASTAKDAMKNSYEHAQRVKSLNGMWQFNWVAHPDNRPIDFYKPDFNATSWSKIEVPSTVEREGYGTPHYVNIRYPFKVNPPFVMGEPDKKYTTYKERNPVGSYRRTFSVPADWKGQQVILHFGGVSSAAFVWVNGKKVGYTQGSRLAAEFDITSYLNEGENLLAVETYKYCDGAYLEDQDYWRLSGIYRDVFIRAVPKVSMWDVYAQPKVDVEKRKGEVAVELSTANFDNASASDYSITVKAFSPKGKLLATKDGVKLKSIDKGFSDHKLITTIQMNDIDLWFADKPVQYSCLVELKRNNETVQAINLPVAFREIVVKDAAFYLNGELMKIRGVNRHEFSADQGWTVTREQMEREVQLLKQGNVNFVRTAHYPNDPRWYELCNQYGVMIMDEVNVETHQISYHKRILPGDDPKWEGACMDRMERMVIRDRQQPSVIMWSLGNEAGFGNAFLKMYDLTKEVDHEQRPVHYAGMNVAADMDSQTYKTIKWLEQHVQHKAKRQGERGETSTSEQHGKYPSGKPFVMNEYSHAMGNSLGNFRDYWELIYKHNMLPGGFIWDWIDQALYKDQKTQKGFVYGGDFGDHPTDLNFCVNGIIGSDLIPHPHYFEMQKVYQPIWIEMISRNPLKIKINNHSCSTNTNEYQFGYEVTYDGKIVAKKKLKAISIAPNSSKVITIAEKASLEHETFIKFAFKHTENRDWAKKGDVLAWDQFLISDKQMVKPVEMTDASGLIKSNDAIVKIGNENFQMSFDKATGYMQQLKYADQTAIVSPMKLNFWRALTDNDRGWRVHKKMSTWINEADNFTLERFDVKEVGGFVKINAQYLFKKSKAKAQVNYKIDGEGNIQVATNFTIPESCSALPRLGWQMEITSDMNNVAWYGRGPSENYQDRKSGSAVGFYKSTINEWIHPYVMPQENSNRCDIRWIEFGSKKQGLRFTATQSHMFSASAYPFTQQMLDKSKHDFELKRHKNNVINIDYDQMGVGGDNSWGHPVLKQYQMKPGNYQWTFTISKK